MKDNKVRRNAKQLLSLTNFIQTEFEAFIPTFEYHWNRYYNCFTLKGKPREQISYNRKMSRIPMSVI